MGARVCRGSERVCLARRLLACAEGYGLFQSDHNLDIIGDLGDEVGLTKLEKDAREKPQEMLSAEEGAKGIKQDENDYENSVGGRIHYSAKPSYCTDLDAVLNYLKSSGELEKAIEKWTAKTRDPRGNQSCFDPGYTLALLGACAMIYGCTPRGARTQSQGQPLLVVRKAMLRFREISRWLGRAFKKHWVQPLVDRGKCKGCKYRGQACEKRD